MSATTTATPVPGPRRPLSLGVIFLTLYIDLVGFSIIFPLGPDMLDYYLKLEGRDGVLGWLLSHTEALAHTLGNEHHFEVVLFGGVISSLFSLLQFVLAPFWGSLSDRQGRRGVLLLTVAGTGLGYLLWVCSGSFWLFLLSRIVCGAFSGNLSVATAAVADVTTREERARAMGIVGAAFGLGLVTGPMLGALTAHYNLLNAHPGLARFGINPFTLPALIAFAMCALNLVWISLRFRETLGPAAQAEARGSERERNPLRAILALKNPAARQINLVAFVYSIAFVAMEATLTFLSAERFGYTARQNGYLLGFLGVCSIVTQGVIVRRLLKTMEEIHVLGWGLALSAAGLLWTGLATAPWMLYSAIVLSSIGSGLVNPASTGLISLYSGANEQGRVLGIFRSLGALSRAFTPVLAGVVFWLFGSCSIYVASALLALVALGLCTKLPKPVK
ncbi:MAG: MFS transporter [Opitutae bacterium]|nr:MFS transporter [Opitutae bacterium]